MPGSSGATPGSSAHATGGAAAAAASSKPLIRRARQAIAKRNMESRVKQRGGAWRPAVSVITKNKPKRSMTDVSVAYQKVKLRGGPYWTALLEAGKEARRACAMGASTAFRQRRRGRNRTSIRDGGPAAARPAAAALPPGPGLAAAAAAPAATASAVSSTAIVPFPADGAAASRAVALLPEQRHKALAQQLQTIRARARADSTNERDLDTQDLQSIADWSNHSDTRNSPSQILPVHSPPWPADDG